MSAGVHEAAEQVAPRARELDVTGDAPDLMLTLRQAQQRAEAEYNKLVISEIEGAIDRWIVSLRLGAEDAQELARDIVEATQQPDFNDAIKIVIAEWTVTANALRDPGRRSVLLGDVTADEMLPADRPG